MENFEQNSNDGTTTKEDGTSEKVTLRLPSAVVQKIKEMASEWQVSQSAAAAKLLSSDSVSPHARPLIKGAVAAPADHDEDEQTLMEKDIKETWERLDDLHNTTCAIEARIEEINRLQDALFTALKNETTAVTKATENFSELGKKSAIAVYQFDKLEKKFLEQFDVQKKTVQDYLDQTRKDIVSAAFDGHAVFEERVDKKLRAAERLIERADHLDSSFANYFANGVAHFLPEVERLKGSIERDLKKIKIFHAASYIVGGLVFLLGLAAVTYYRPVLDVWDKSQVATEATKAVTAAYAKELTQWQNKVKELEFADAIYKENEKRRLEEIRADVTRKAQAEVEGYRIKVFEKQAQRYQKEIEEMSRGIGYLKHKLSEQCRFFCFGDYDD